MLRRSILLILTAALIPVVHSASQPRPTKSKYLLTTAAGFVLEPNLGAQYNLSFLLRAFPLPDLYVVGTFENPEDPSTPLRLEQKVEAGALQFSMKSPYFHRAQNGRAYLVRLALYADAEHTKTWGTHEQKVLFSLRPDMAEEVKRRFGVEF